MHMRKEKQQKAIIEGTTIGYFQLNIIQYCSEWPIVSVKHHSSFSQMNHNRQRSIEASGNCQHEAYDNYFHFCSIAQYILLYCTYISLVLFYIFISLHCIFYYNVNIIP